MAGIDPPLTFGPPPAALQRAALERAHEFLPPEQRSVAISELLRASTAGERSLEGLFAAYQGGCLAGALWMEAHPGHSATLWPPRSAPSASPDLDERLLIEALATLRATNVDLVQCLLASDSGDDADLLRRAGFEHGCDLLFLFSDAGHFPEAEVGSGIEFERVDLADFDELATLIEGTYENTRDCPALDARRNGRQVLADYRATCRDDLSHWFFARQGQSRIGCLLLGHDQTCATWELVYMGLVASARGRGWGRELVRMAQWIVALRQGTRLLLAVDAQNEPALRTYAAAGFIAWDRRSVFLKAPP